MTEIVQFGVFRSSDNLLVRTGSGQVDLVETQAGPGEYAKVGHFEFPPMPPVVKFARLRRREAYPPVGEQLAAIADLAKALRASGFAVPQSVADWLAALDAVKAAHPKDR